MTFVMKLMKWKTLEFFLKIKLTVAVSQCRISSRIKYFNMECYGRKKTFLHTSDLNAMNQQFDLVNRFNDCCGFDAHCQKHKSKRVCSLSKPQNVSQRILVHCLCQRASIPSLWNHKWMKRQLNLLWLDDMYVLRTHSQIHATHVMWNNFRNNGYFNK